VVKQLPGWPSLLRAWVASRLGCENSPGAISWFILFGAIVLINLAKRVSVFRLTAYFTVKLWNL
jgi:hypothetical protein